MSSERKRPAAVVACTVLVFVGGGIAISAFAFSLILYPQHDPGTDGLWPKVFATGLAGMAIAGLGMALEFILPRKGGSGR